MQYWYFFSGHFSMNYYSFVYSCAYNLENIIFKFHCLATASYHYSGLGAQNGIPIYTIYM